MNYYIQGDAANAQGIKAAFEKKGFIKEDRDIYENNVLFFTVDDDKNVHYCWIDQPYCNIVKTHPDYQELELPEKENEFEDYSKLVVVTNGKDFWKGMYNYGGEYWLTFDLWPIDDATHWMDIQPPRKED